jgi:3-dehydroquinate synthetase
MGGGAVLDMVSFAAAIAHRGIRVLRLPTTVLSQADSGIAVKNSVNLFGKKNFVGTFVPPFAVINDSRFLESLDPRDRISGVAEAVKVALLRDPGFYRYLETNVENIANGDLTVLNSLIRRSAELHLAHICGNGDPFELGSARPLDFGHWAAHKLESMTHHRLRHGEAVAIGLALDVTYSVKQGYLPRAVAEGILRLLEGLGFRLWDSALNERAPEGRPAIVHGLREFREHLGGELHVTLLRGIGQGFEVNEMDEAVVASAIDELQARGSDAAERPELAVASRIASAPMIVGGRFHLILFQHSSGRTWSEVNAALTSSLPRVRALLGHRGPFAVGLRLSAQAAKLSNNPASWRRSAVPRAGDYYVLTINGFPYGAFHGERVKERCIQPDWRNDDRFDYTNRLARLLAALLADRRDIEGASARCLARSARKLPAARTRGDGDPHPPSRG